MVPTFGGLANIHPHLFFDIYLEVRSDINLSIQEKLLIYILRFKFVILQIFKRLCVQQKLPYRFCFVSDDIVCYCAFFSSFITTC
jgi:hypothetical protein